MESTSNNFFNSSNWQTQRPPFQGLDELLGENLPLSDREQKPVVDSIIDPFAGDVSGQLNQLVFDRLQSVMSENPSDGGDSSSLPQNNATIGNGNRNFGSDSATIGNGNWNFNHNNGTIGNGNWLFAGDNKTLGNGNWYWDEGSSNATLGNGNWQFNSNNSTIGNGNWGFGNNNTTIGNGNWDFGNNNTIIGNGNWIFEDNNTVVGNGNWVIDENNQIIGNEKSTKDLELVPPDIKTDVDNLIDSLMGRMGENFLPLTANLGESEMQTLNRLILSENNGNVSTDIEQFLALLSKIKTNAVTHQPWYNPQTVPEPTFSTSLLVVGIVCLLWSKFKQGFFRQLR
ncbi:hypothetical protein NWP17_08625 [Chrysosporum bergii ANA360D]|uniref:Uncharacterized protein n=1 Tax=Chrysosporum bergii ANA360D TaxID=617107 RepID=A0AA43GSA6_9CYAN|nr:hypothetical protein [Chrysosporum bergii]MDH6060500.1 hypothetical protein [Chrysosporum bergii ANA360D]